MFGNGEMPVRPADKAVRRANLRRIAGLFRAYRSKLSGVCGLIVISAALGVVSPFLLRGVLDTAIPHHRTGLLAALVLGMIGFSIVTGVLGDAWHDAAGIVRSRLEVPLTAKVLPPAPTDAGIHIGLRGAVLVRPDGHVAWRMPYLPDDPVAALSEAVEAILK